MKHVRKSNQVVAFPKPATKQPYQSPTLVAQGSVVELTATASMAMGSLFGMMSPSLPDAPTR